MEYSELEKHLMRFRHDDIEIESDGEYMFYRLYTKEKETRRLTHCGVAYEKFIYSVSLPKYDGDKR